MMSKYIPNKIAAASLAIVILSACGSAPKLAEPSQLLAVAPTPIESNKGKYMSPYTSDDVLAEWVDKAMNAKIGSSIGSAVGAHVGEQALSHVPFIGSMLGQKVGNAAGRSIAIKASGGMEFIKESSDRSFSNLNDLSVFIYANYGTTEHFQSALDATTEIYPELRETYQYAISKASANVVD